MPLTTLGTNTAALNNAYAKRASTTAVLYAVDYGVKTDGTDSTAALQAAISALPQTGNNRGGRIELPSGDVTLAGQLDLRQLENVTIGGLAAMPRSYAPTRLLFTRADSTSCILVGSANSVTFRGLRIETTNSAYSGKIIDTGAAVVADCQMFRLENVNIKAAGTAATLVSLLHCVGATISRCNFSGGAVAIKGYSATTGYAIATQYSIAVTIDGESQFGNHATAALYNPSYDWNVIGNIFSPGPSGLANAISGDMTIQAKGLLIVGNYFGDAGVSGTYVKVFAQGAQIAGNYFDGDAVTGLFITRPSYGVTVSGNTMRHGTAGVDIDCDPNTGASPSIGVVVIGNSLGGTTKIQNHTATNMKVLLTGNNGVSDLDPNTPEFSQGFTVGTAASGTSFATNGDITMKTNRVLKGYQIADANANKGSLFLNAFANEGISIRAEATGVVPLTVRQIASPTVDALQIIDSGSTKHVKITKATTTVPASLVVGAAALPTTSTDGFIYAPSVAGTPTGVPTAQTGTVPMVVDTTGSKLWFYVGGAWKSTTLA